MTIRNTCQKPNVSFPTIIRLGAACHVQKTVIWSIAASRQPGPEIGCKKTRENKEKSSQRRKEAQDLQNLASTLLNLLAAAPEATATSSKFAAGAVTLAGAHPFLFFSSHDGIDRHCKNFINTAHFLATAFDIGSIHSPGDCLALFRCDGSQSLRFQKFNASPLHAQIRLQTDKNYRRGGTEMQYFGIPLFMLVRCCGKTRGE
jgi:hypothetical protein